VSRTAENAARRIIAEQLAGIDEAALISRFAADGGHEPADVDLDPLGIRRRLGRQEWGRAWAVWCPQATTRPNVTNAT
jgi:hypothetical protein